MHVRAGLSEPLPLASKSHELARKQIGVKSRDFPRTKLGPNIDPFPIQK